MFTTVDDFINDYKISTDNWSEDELEAYIAKLEPLYLEDLLGVELYKLFVASVNTAPAGLPKGDYLTIYNALSYDDTAGSCGHNIVRSQGMKDMLLGFIFFDFCRDQPVFNTPIGDVEEVAENSTKLSALRAGMNEKYNRAVVSYNAIQSYIRLNRNNYLDFNGLKKEEIYY